MIETKKEEEEKRGEGENVKENMKHTSGNMKRLGTKTNVDFCHLKIDAKEEACESGSYADVMSFVENGECDMTFSSRTQEADVMISASVSG